MKENLSEKRWDINVNVQTFGNELNFLCFPIQFSEFEWKYIENKEEEKKGILFWLWRKFFSCYFFVIAQRFEIMSLFYRRVLTAAPFLFPLLFFFREREKIRSVCIFKVHIFLLQLKMRVLTAKCLIPKKHSCPFIKIYF